VKPSFFLEEQRGGTCPHEWDFEHRWPTFDWGPRCRLTYGRNAGWSVLAEYYEDYPVFRSFVLDQERAGRFTRAEFVAATLGSGDDLDAEFTGDGGGDPKSRQFSDTLLREYHAAHPLK
jgi:hypothetical protein